MNIYDQFPSKYLKAGDLQGRSVRAKIANVVTEILGNDSKMILYFVGKEKGMVANRTNCMTLADAWGPETENWTGGNIEIFSMKVPFQGKLTDSLRVRPLPNKPAQPPRQAVPPQAVVPSMPPTPPVEAYDDSFEDVPF